LALPPPETARGNHARGFSIMFKLQPNPTFKTKVAISVAGEKRQPEIDVEFKYLNKERVK